MTLETVDQDLLTIPEAAAVLGVVPTTIHTYIAKGKLTVASRANGRKHVRRSELEAFEFDHNSLPRVGRRRGDGAFAPYNTLAVLADVGAATSTELAFAVDKHPGNIRRHLAVLRHRQFVIEHPGGAYEVTDAGHAYLQRENAQAS